VGGEGSLEGENMCNYLNFPSIIKLSNFRRSRKGKVIFFAPYRNS
jgi:hypothetical protein